MRIDETAGASAGTVGSNADCSANTVMKNTPTRKKTMHHYVATKIFTEDGFISVFGGQQDGEWVCYVDTYARFCPPLKEVFKVDSEQDIHDKIAELEKLDINIQRRRMAAEFAEAKPMLEEYVRTGDLLYVYTNGFVLPNVENINGGIFNNDVAMNWKDWLEEHNA